MPPISQGASGTNFDTNIAGCYMGDYNQIAVDSNGNTYFAYGDNRIITSGTPDPNVFFFEQPAVSISLTTSGQVPFGTVPLGKTIDTTPSGINDVQTVQVTNGPANLSLESSNFSDGTNIWTLGTANGANQVKWDFSPDGSAWTNFSSPNTLFSLASNVASGGTSGIYLRLTMPTSTLSNKEQASTVTVVATAP